MRCLIPCLALSFTALMPLCAADLLANPAFQQPTPTPAAPPASVHSWELPAISVKGDPLPALREDEHVGTYGQPRWTTTRRFTEVRTYVIPEGQFDFEYWLKIEQPTRQEMKDADAAGKPTPKSKVTQMYEAEMGLGHRLQLDLYQVYVKDGSNGENQLDATKFEIRYAFADWGVIPLNPTAYVEWEQAAQGADSAEVKLLLAHSSDNGVGWGSNLVYEAKTGDAFDRSLEFNNAVSYTLIDEKFSVGLEQKLARVDALMDDEVNGGYLDARDHHWELAIGPSIRWFLIPRAHVDLAVFVGLNNDTSRASTTMIAGWEF